MGWPEEGSSPNFKMAPSVGLPCTRRSATGLLAVTGLVTEQSSAAKACQSRMRLRRELFECFFGLHVSVDKANTGDRHLVLSERAGLVVTDDIDAS